ncbi:MAG: hypothetical protein ACTSPY_09585 [Candidatus Helarchaeota archaeon]
MSQNGYFLHYLYFIFMSIFNISLIVYNIISFCLLFYIVLFKFKILNNNPYRTSPICLVTNTLSLISINIIDVCFFFGISLTYFSLSLIWITIAINFWVAFYTLVIWKGTNIRSLIIHINMILNGIYLILVVYDETFFDPINIYLPILGLCSVIITQLILNRKKYVPAPHYISKKLDELVNLYIKIFKQHQELLYLEKLIISSKYPYVKENAKKTLDLYLSNKITKFNLKNNLFLLILIDNDISVGKFRKIFYNIR